MKQTRFDSIGDKKLLKLPKVAFFASNTTGSDYIDKSLKWADEMRRQNKCVVSGFHSKIERGIFCYLLKCKSPIIWVLARGIFDEVPEDYREAVESGRLLILSPFVQTIDETTRSLAFVRNDAVIQLADSVVAAYIKSGGMLEMNLRENQKQIKIL